MRGTGTQESPYIITTAEELYSMKELGGADVYFELGNDIDFNGTAYSENFEPIPLNCAVFDGKNFAIRNIYKNAPIVDLCAFETLFSGTVTVKNLLLDNTTLMGYSVSLIKASDKNNSTVNMYNCTILLNLKRSNTVTPSSSSISKTCVMHGEYVVVNTELCSIAVNGDFASPYPFIRNGRVYRTHIDVNYTMRALYTNNSYDSAFFSYVSVDDSWISGRVKSVEKATTAKIMHMSDQNANFNNFYHIVTYEEIPTMNWYGKMSGCFYDADIIGSAECAGTEIYIKNFNALTTAQCKDAEYLKSIGFVCEGGEA
jgi:hypothetical protein